MTQDKQENKSVYKKEEKALLAAALPTPKTRLEVEISELLNFTTGFNDGRE
jgi:hypothetical protein